VASEHPRGSPRGREAVLSDASDSAVTPVRPLISRRGIGVVALTICLAGVLGWVQLRAPTPEPSSPPGAKTTAVVATVAPAEAPSTASSVAAPPPEPPSAPPSAATASPAASVASPPNVVPKKLDPVAHPVVTPPRYTKPPGGGEVVDPWKR
jgi:hypothetical protein